MAPETQRLALGGTRGKKAPLQTTPSRLPQFEYILERKVLLPLCPGKGNDMTTSKNPSEAAPITPSVEATAPQVLSLWQQIVEDWQAHDRDWTRPGFRAIAVYRFGVWRMQIQPKLLRAPLSLLYRMLFRKIRNTYGIELPYSAKVGRRVIIEHQSGIVIHGDCVIGDDCIIRQGVTLGNRHRDRPLDAPHLGDRVNVGAGAKIFGAIVIGDDANIGANAVVLHDLPVGATAVGIPAKVVKIATPANSQ